MLSNQTSGYKSKCTRIVPILHRLLVERERERERERCPLFFNCVICLFNTVPWFGLQSLSVTLPGHAYLITSWLKDKKFNFTHLFNGPATLYKRTKCMFS